MSKPIKVGPISARPDEREYILEIPVIADREWRGTEAGERKLDDTIAMINEALPDYDYDGTASKSMDDGYRSECTLYVKCRDRQDAAAAAEAVKARLTESVDVWLAAMPLGNNTVTGIDPSRRYRGGNGSHRTGDTNPPPGRR